MLLKIPLGIARSVWGCSFGARCARARPRGGRERAGRRHPELAQHQGAPLCTRMAEPSLLPVTPAPGAPSTGDAAGSREAAGGYQDPRGSFRPCSTHCNHFNIFFSCNFTSKTSRIHLISRIKVPRAVLLLAPQLGHEKGAAR